MKINENMKMGRGPSAESRKAGAFTLVELLTVIAIIAILAGLVVGLAGRANKNKTISRVRTELAALETAIDSYKNKLNFYPPDGMRTNALSPLFYELAGTSSYEKGGQRFFKTLQGDEEISAATINTIFGRQGFANSVEANNSEGVKATTFFKEMKSGVHYREIEASPDVEVMIVPVAGPNDYPGPANSKPLNTWRYVSDPANHPGYQMHNPGEYDLWAEIVIGGKTNIIGNWKE